ncbi:MAG: hotdog fold thioesterase [Bacteroidales bacterium]|nr:hotdog fold thioesterase [Candidatus Cryptobacteroides faecihippi]MCQ2162589.1 hotdog fold thioesterase [Bacteroidales bacterium]
MTLLDNLNENDHFARNAGAKLTEIREGFARAELTVGEMHVNAAGVCQGGVIYTLADFAFAAVANSRGIMTLGISNTLTLLKSAKIGDTLTAECTELLDHHKLPYCDIGVFNQNKELIAVMTGLGYRLNKEFGYDSLM